MGRITEALRRAGGSLPIGETARQSGELRTGSPLQEFAHEQSSRPDEQPRFSNVVHALPAKPTRPMLANAGTKPHVPPSAPQAAVSASVPPPGPPVNDPPDTDALIDVRLIADFAGFVLGSVMRHKWLVVTLFVLMVGVTAGLLKALPKTYHVQTRLLAQRNDVMSALVNPGRAIPRDAETPSRRRWYP